MTKLVFSDEWLRDYEKRTGLGEHGKTTPQSAKQTAPLAQGSQGETDDLILQIMNRSCGS